MLNLKTLNQGLRTFKHLLLRQAIQAGNQARIASLLQGTIEVNRVDEDGRTLLHDAAQMNALAVVRVMLERGADVNKQDAQGITPLHLAARSGHAEVVSVLLKHNVDIDARDEFAQTPLFEAAENGQESIVALLLQAGANVQAVDQRGVTPFHLALAEGRVSIANVIFRYLRGPIDLSVHPRCIPVVTAFNRCWERPTSQSLLLSAHNKWFYALAHMLLRVRNKAVYRALLEKVLKRYPNDSYDSVLSLISFFFIKSQGVENIHDDYLEQWFNRSKSDPLLRKCVEQLWGLIRNPQRISQELKNDLVEEALVWGSDRFLGQLLRSGGVTKHKDSLIRRIMHDTNGGMLVARCALLPSQFGKASYLPAGVFTQVKSFLKVKDLYALALTSKRLSDSCSPERLLEPMVTEVSVSSDCEMGGGAKPH